MNKAYLDPEDVLRLIDAADNLRDKLLVTLLFHLGCRISEALAICVEDIDLSGGTVTIKHLKSRIKLKCPDCGSNLAMTSVFCPKCGKRIEEAVKTLKEHRKQRVLPMDSELVAMVRQFVSLGGPVNVDGRRRLFAINRHRAWQIVKELGQKAGLPRIINTETGKVHYISPHKMRDAFSVNAVKHDDSGDGLRMLQEHLGHSSFNTTAKYRKVAGEEHRRWYDDLWKANGHQAKT
ncbi:MAG: tyrosine-type recombinase/integrase [Dehalococcoides mccartyi]|uniref:tyrosine-type recombinase/integrase n=1 Tax=Dehalococcoides mccartyi TaxID=61435 RepID=UPI0030F5ED46